MATNETTAHIAERVVVEVTKSIIEDNATQDMSRVNKRTRVRKIFKPIYWEDAKIKEWGIKILILYLLSITPCFMEHNHSNTLTIAWFDVWMLEIIFPYVSYLWWPLAYKVAKRRLVYSLLLDVVLAIITTFSLLLIPELYQS